jgi:hypothetical protein
MPELKEEKGQLSKKIWFKDTPEDGARLAPKHVGQI